MRLEKLRKSQPARLDAIRLVDCNAVILTNSAPHSSDPRMPPLRLLKKGRQGLGAT